MIKLSPSILASNMMHLEKEIRIFEKMNVPYIHIDVMDGMFVPNFSFGTAAIKNIRRATGITLDVHLMVVDPMKHLKVFCDCGADIISFHYEAANNPVKIIDKIKQYNKKASMVINPSTDAEYILPYVEYLDQVLVMGVVPGFGGQGLLPGTVEKIKKIRNYANLTGKALDIEVDGGVLTTNVGRLIKAGANVIVCGSSVYKDYKLEENIKKLYNAFEEAQ